MAEIEPTEPETIDASYTKMTADIYDAIYVFKDYEGEAAKLKSFIDSYKQTGGNELLDVACGTGLHLPYLSEDFAITGIDLSESQLVAARRRMPDVEFHYGDMKNFHIDQKFDIVTCLFSSIGYVQPLNEMEKAVVNMAGHLKTGGLLIIEPWLKPQEFDPDKPVHTDRGKLPDGSRVTRTTKNRAIIGNLSVFDMAHTIEGPDGLVEFTEHHELASYTVDEFRHAYEQADLEFNYDEQGLSGRSLYIGVKKN